MEPNYKAIAEELFSLSEGEKIESIFETEIDLEKLDSVLGFTGKIAFPHLKVPDEVALFIDALYQYVEQNHVEE